MRSRGEGTERGKGEYHVLQFCQLAAAAEAISVYEENATTLYGRNSAAGHDKLTAHYIVSLVRPIMRC